MMYLSGSSMAVPIAAGTAALLLQANPNLTPGLVKAILMYTAQPLASLNTLEQGAGEINIDGALRLAQLIRTDLNSATPLDAPLLAGATPTQVSNINGQSFCWAGGVILNHTYATGPELIINYQKVYSRGFILGDGVVETDSTQATDPNKFTSSILLGQTLLTSNGAAINGGFAFLNVGLLLGNGLMLSDGILIGDGVMVGDGVLVGDGVMVGDSSSASIHGDDTWCMR